MCQLPNPFQTCHARLAFAQGRMALRQNWEGKVKIRLKSFGKSGGAVLQAAPCAPRAVSGPSEPDHLDRLSRLARRIMGRADQKRIGL